MISSEYLYGGLDIKTAKLQLALFKRKKEKAQEVINSIKPYYDLLNFSEDQKSLQKRVDKIKKAIIFCDEQIEEALETISEAEEKKMFNKLMKKMQYKTKTNKWNFDEIQYDLIVYIILAAVIYIAITYN